MFLRFTQWEYCRYMASSPCNLQEHGDKHMCWQCSLRKTHVPAIFPLGEYQEHVEITSQMYEMFLVGKLQVHGSMTFRMCTKCSCWEHVKQSVPVLAMFLTCSYLFPGTLVPSDTCPQHVDVPTQLNRAVRPGVTHVEGLAKVYCEMDTRRPLRVQL